MKGQALTCLLIGAKIYEHARYFEIYNSNKTVATCTDSLHSQGSKPFVEGRLDCRRGVIKIPSRGSQARLRELGRTAKRRLGRRAAT